MSGNEIAVHVNRGSTDSLETETESLETHRQVTIALHGHERPAHVHCRVGGDLDAIASIAQTNHYLEPERVTTVPVDVDADRLDEPIEGSLEVITAYGAESIEIELTVTPGPPDVTVDKTLSKPNRSPPEPTAADRLAGAFDLEPGTLAVVALGLFSLAIATVTAATIGGPTAMVGLLVVTGGVVVALWLLLQ
ncbi:hypothetical protein ACLI4Z_04460 [Natrialbaceae archaeon A-arb3/5]